ncbi:MAG TPA: hypothetical protein VFJ76_07735 [Solirubrobacterales bacterium]|nr:hypothetical protein [Solirubrobacterales bacterium]
MARYQPFPFQGFGAGLDLASKPDNVDPASCIDALNVLFSDRGAITQRPGYDNGTASPLTNAVASLEPFYQTSGTKQLLAGCGTRLEALSSSFAVVKSLTGLTNAVWDFARFGQPNAEVAYAGNGTDTLRKWNGSEWSAPTATVGGEASKAMPKAGALCVDPSNNRLVCSGFSTTTGGPNGLTSSPSHVYFSDPGNPESYETTAFIQLTPGDGERVQAVTAWKEFVFAFKETKFFVLFQTGTDSEGKPEFDYRAVDASAGLASPRAVVAHPSGVYFMARNGVYRTTGQEPELISSLVEPIWSGDISPFYTGGVLAHGSITNCAMGTWEDRIYLAFPTESTNSRVLVYDPQFEWWSLLSIPASCFATFRPSNQPELVFGYASGSNHVGRHSRSYTNDDGAAITSYWRSGWFDLGSSSQKKIRASKAWGAGKCPMAVAPDFQQGVGKEELLDFTDTTASTWSGATWGGSEWAEPKGLVGKERRIAERGTVFSAYFRNETLDQEWSVHRLEHLIPTVRDPAKGTE